MSGANFTLKAGRQEIEVFAPSYHPNLKVLGLVSQHAFKDGSPSHIIALCRTEFKSPAKATLQVGKDSYPVEIARIDRISVSLHSPHLVAVADALGIKIPLPLLEATVAKFPTDS